MAEHPRHEPLSNNIALAAELFGLTRGDLGYLWYSLSHDARL